MMSRDPSEQLHPPGGRVLWFALALGLFATWAIGLGVMAFTSSERPRAPESAPAPRSS
jgi:hypothetical protein